MKSLFALLILLGPFTLFSQDKNVSLPPNWFNLDLASDGYFGISAEKAYNDLLKDKQPLKKIIVAVIDGGVDIGHEDLKTVLWTNAKEIPNNGIDDDKNGYVDDVNGWNFIGSKAGNLAYDNLELVRIKRKLEPKYRSTIVSTVLDSAEKAEYALYRRATADFGKKYDEASSAFPIYIAIKKVLDSVAGLNKGVLTEDALAKYQPDDEVEEQIMRIINRGSRKEGGLDKFYTTIKKGYKELDVMLKYCLNLKFDDREKLVGDDYNNSSERFYGNNDVKGPNADHGSHVSGIIGADRTNGIGIMGISNSVQIMALRVVPEGDERDKDVANAIRYAADNGAQVINMSFGKTYKWDKKTVDEAVRYADNKGVLLVHAAGNENQDNDKEQNYPSRFYDSPEMQAYEQEHAKPLTVPVPSVQGRVGGSFGSNRPAQLQEKPLDTSKFNFPHANNWIEVGASAYKNDVDLKASFSNYGKHSVDVFAPGFMIKSTVPDSKYEEFDGTSMAAPVVSGLAALIWSYYPKFSASDIKSIITRSVVKVDQKVKFTNARGESSRVPFSTLCTSGGIVNAYNSLILAAKLATSK